MDSLLLNDVKGGMLELRTAVAGGHSEEVKSRTEELEKWVKVRRPYEGIESLFRRRFAVLFLFGTRASVVQASI